MMVVAALGAIAVENLLDDLRDTQLGIEQSTSTSIGITGLTAIQTDVSQRLADALGPVLGEHVAPPLGSRMRQAAHPEDSHLSDARRARADHRFTSPLPPAAYPRLRLRTPPLTVSGAVR